MNFDPDRVDLPLLLAVRDIRRELWACTHAEVANRLEISKASAQQRITAAVKRGHVKQSHLRGSVSIGDNIGVLTKVPVGGKSFYLLDLDGELLDVILL